MYMYIHMSVSIVRWIVLPVEFYPASSRGVLVCSLHTTYIHSPIMLIHTIYVIFLKKQEQPISSAQWGSVVPTMVNISTQFQHMHAHII